MSSIPFRALATVGVSAAVLVAPPVSAITVWSLNSTATEGLTYVLTGTEASASQWSFVLDISGINSVVDTRKGRTALEDLAWNKPSGYVTASLPGSTVMNGGLNSGGCNGSGASQFCFDDVLQAVSGSTMQLNFTIDAPAASFASWIPHIKVDWNGNVNNYDNVSQNMTVVPEPQAYSMALGALAVLAMFTRRRQK